MLAVYHGHHDLTRYLLRRKSLNLLAEKPVSGETIIDIARNRGNEEGLKIIRQEGDLFQKLQAVVYCRSKGYGRAYIYKLMKNYF